MADPDELVSRRLCAAKLLANGMSPAKVANEVGVSRSTVYRWREQVQAGNTAALATTNVGGRPARLSPDHIEELRTLIQAGPVRAGSISRPWTLERIQRLVAKQWQIRLSVAQLSRVLKNNRISTKDVVRGSGDGSM
jgi:transposase